MTNRTKVLVLNQDYQALGVCTAERAFVLVLMGKAEMLTDVPQLKLKSITQDFLFPSVIRLFRYITIPFRRVSLSRQNVFKRDGNCCVYCGSHNHLTLDHLVPKAKGGKDSWKNLVTACRKCNAKKGDLTPEEAEMEMSSSPFRPSFVMFLGNFSGQVREDWKPYLYMS